MATFAWGRAVQLHTNRQQRRNQQMLIVPSLKTFKKGNEPERESRKRGEDALRQDHPAVQHEREAVFKAAESQLQER